MLIELSIGNYKSFHEIVTLSMEATPITAKKKSLDINNLFPVQVEKEIHLLRSAVIYGSNASGKSNIVKAFEFMRYFVRNSSKESQSKDPIGVEPFLLSDETVNEPSFFEVVFLMEGTQYRYGFEATIEKVVKEWLYYIPNKRETKLFEREETTKFSLSGTFREGKDFTDKTRDNALFLSVVSQFNGKIAQKILEWFRNVNSISGIEDNQYLPYTVHCLKEGKYRDDIVEFIRNLDLSISDVQAETIKVTADMLPEDFPENIKKELLDSQAERHKITTFHKKYSADGQTSLTMFDFETQESEGTQKIIALAGPLIDTLKKGRILVIDEFDARLHPLINREIVRLFHSPETNPHNAQLICMTHDTNLLDRNLFRRDQIWFTEKNSRGASSLYSLVEYKVRNDASFEKDYIQGRYGAIPYIGNISQIIGDGNDE